MRRSLQILLTLMYTCNFSTKQHHAHKHVLYVIDVYNYALFWSESWCMCVPSDVLFSSSLFRFIRRHSSMRMLFITNSVSATTLTHSHIHITVVTHHFNHTYNGKPEVDNVLLAECVWYKNNDIHCYLYSDWNYLRTF